MSIFGKSHNMTLTMVGLGFAVLAYLLGSIPTAIWVGRKYFGVDVREHGSGNAGATNVFRVLGKGPGTVVLLLDILKGYLAVRLVDLMPMVMAFWGSTGQEAVSSGAMTGMNSGLEQAVFQLSTADYRFYAVVFGVMSVIGHLLPVFARFKGGKGVATLFGMIIALDAEVALLALGVFLVANILSGYVSVGSLLAGISIPVLFLRVFQYQSLSIQVFSISVAVLILVTHRKNMQRLWLGEETKSRILGKKNKA